jgi:hypothetical protein
VTAELRSDGRLAVLWGWRKALMEPGGCIISVEERKGFKGKMQRCAIFIDGMRFS